MNSECPRCHKEFACRADNIQLCDCAKIEFIVTPELRQILAEKYDGCLCVGCLNELATVMPSHPQDGVWSSQARCKRAYGICSNHMDIIHADARRR